LDIQAVASTENADRLRQARAVAEWPIVHEQETLVRTQLTTLGVSQQEQVDLLVKHLAVTQLLLRAEVTYRTIFGSQILLLKSLNTTGGATRDQLSKFYEDAKAEFPQAFANYSFDQYLQYLLGFGLIRQDRQHYEITVAGQEFLKWMPTARVPDKKAF
jgi:hypothetical protein